ncbi:MAG: hypothetical protein SR1Q5_01665 [Quinella sp. 1Q5]|nr:hypothetical protein [Quinella sp. 1Q5]
MMIQKSCKSLKTARPVLSVINDWLVEAMNKETDSKNISETVKQIIRLIIRSRTAL